MCKINTGQMSEMAGVRLTGVFTSSKFHLHCYATHLYNTPRTFSLKNTTLPLQQGSLFKRHLTLQSYQITGFCKLDICAARDGISHLPFETLLYRGPSEAFSMVKTAWQSNTWILGCTQGIPHWKI